MIHLLDVNVLIALLDSDHVAHEDAHHWFAATADQGWATSAITENGFLRIVGSPSYRPDPWPLDRLIEVLRNLCDHDGHRFWPEDFSLLDESRVRHDQLTRSAQLTDTYLLALAVRNGGRLATFDRRLATRAVPGGEEALYVIPARSSVA